MSLKIYSVFFIALDGNLQCEEMKIDTRYGVEKIRVYMRSSVPSEGIEFDGRPYVGTERRVNVKILGFVKQPLYTMERTLDGAIAHGADYVMNRSMKLIHFAVGHEVNKIATARYVFECETLDPRVVRTEGAGWSGESVAHSA